MTVENIIGLQWGDEGKGKEVDSESYRLTRDLEQNQKIIVARYQGGPNAGHTLKVDGKKIGLHLISSGILNDKTYNFLCSGVHINPVKLNAEVQKLNEANVTINESNFGVSSKAHLILPNQIYEDGINYNREIHSSTGNGIAQSSRDKHARSGIRIISALDKRLLYELLVNNFQENYGTKATNVIHNSGLLKTICCLVNDAVLKLEPFLRDEAKVFSDKQFKHTIFEGAQGVMLDVEYGEFPGTTSTSPLLIPRKYDKRIGVFKLYSSSVGIDKRPFVADFQNIYDEKTISHLRQKWEEHGVSTGKPRNIGMFDLVAAKYALAIADPEILVGTCLDRLEEIGKINKDLYIVTGYKIGKNVYHDREPFMDNPMALKDAKPVIYKLNTWTKSINKDGTLNDNAKRYIDFIEHELQMEFSKLGIGPSRNQDFIKECYKK